jgi:hypothetical protein
VTTTREITRTDGEPWHLQAKCRGKWDWFDAQEDIEGNSHYPFLREARDLCTQCPVYDTCEEKRKKEITGIWAGEAL